MRRRVRNVEILSRTEKQQVHERKPEADDMTGPENKFVAIFT